MTEFMDIEIAGKVRRVPVVDDDRLSELDEWSEKQTAPTAIAADVVARETLGLTPYVKGSATSQAAAAQIAPELTKLQKRVLDYIASNPGVTDEQIATGLGLNPSTAWPRRVELAKAGRVKMMGATLTRAGRKAYGWRVSTPEEQDF